MKSLLEISPFKILKAAIRAVPAVKYALGIAGIASVIAIVAGLQIDYRVAVFGIPIMIGFMFLLLIFSSLAGQRSKKSLRLPALVFAWAFLILSIMSSTLLATSFFFNWPLDWNPNEIIIKDITISGEVKSMDNGTPISDVNITVDGYDFQTRSKDDGRFIAVLKDVNTEEPITILFHHEDYKSFYTDEPIQNTRVNLEIKLEKR